MLQSKKPMAIYIAILEVDKFIRAELPEVEICLRAAAISFSWVTMSVIRSFF